MRQAFQFIGTIRSDFEAGAAGRNFLFQAISTYELLSSTFSLFGSAVGYVRERSRSKELLNQIASQIQALDAEEQATHEIITMEIEEAKKRLQLEFQTQKAEVEAESAKLRDYVRLQTEKFGSGQEAWTLRAEMHQEIRQFLFQRMERLQELVMLFSSQVKSRYTDDLMERFRLTMRQYKELVEMSIEQEGA